MSKSFKIIFGGFLLILLLLTYLEATEREPINWNPSYLESDKIALGSYVFFESWKDAHTHHLIKVKESPFEFLSQEKPNGTYFFLNNNIPIDQTELDKLLTWVEDGNTLFLSASNFSKNLLDTLDIKPQVLDPGENLKSQPYINLTNSKFWKEEPYHLDQDRSIIRLEKSDSLFQETLGVVNVRSFDSKTRAYPNFIKSQFGNGIIFIHAMPEAFSNYFLLADSNYSYVQDALAYIPSNSNVYWDDHYKSGKIYNTSPLYILLNNRALKWAYYFALFGIFLFIIFEGKRKQRSVPVIEALKNQSYEYSQTISELYLEQKQYKSLALKDIQHFYEYLRSHFRIDTTNINQQFYKEVSARVNLEMEEVQSKFKWISQLSQKEQISKKELQELHSVIQTLKYTSNE